MEEYLELLENPAHGLKRQAMSLAHQIREETGTDMSEALSEAWAEVKGENPGELMLLENITPKRSSKTTFAPSSLTWVLLLGGLATVGYRLAKGNWWWQSLGGVGRRIGRNSTGELNFFRN